MNNQLSFPAGEYLFCPPFLSLSLSLFLALSERETLIM